MGIDAWTTSAAAPTPASLDLDLVGNCTEGALIDRRGRVVWCCMPRFDSPPVFDALLDSADGVPVAGTTSVELEGRARV